MSGYLLAASLRCSAPRERVFACFCDAGHLHGITPERLRFEIVTPRPIAMPNGTLIDDRLRLYGVSFSWRRAIAALQPPAGFVGRQLVGPSH